MGYKLKTHRGARKRFKLTGTGKVKRRHAFTRHILTKKSPGKKRMLGKSAIMEPGDAAKVKQMLPYG
jgi:large subunit ribosomal protein L35